MKATSSIGVVDGEADTSLGRTTFAEPQGRSDQDRLAVLRLDLLWLDAKLFDTPDLNVPVLYSRHLKGDGSRMFETASKRGYENVVLKRAETPYRSKRTDVGVKDGCQGGILWQLESGTHGIAFLRPQRHDWQHRLALAETRSAGPQ